MNANDYRVAGTNRFDFPSVAQFARVCNNDPRIKLRDSGSWTGESLADTLRYAEDGNTARVPGAEAVLETIERECDLATLRAEWTACVAGAFPCVPA